MDEQERRDATAQSICDARKAAEVIYGLAQNPLHAAVACMTLSAFMAQGVAYGDETAPVEDIALCAVLMHGICGQVISRYAAPGMARVYLDAVIAHLRYLGMQIDVSGGGFDRRMEKMADLVRDAGAAS